MEYGQSMKFKKQLHSALRVLMNRGLPCPSIQNRLNPQMTVVKCRATGLRFVNGISSSYNDTYPNELQEILTESEFHDILKKLNETLITYWPCTTCYIFGFACAPCTCGTSLCCPAKCISEAENKAQKLLEQMGYKDKYYDRCITFKIQKGFCSSWLEISYPTSLQNSISTNYEESCQSTSPDEVITTEDCNGFLSNKTKYRRSIVSV
eukprot:gene10518-21934_t